MGWGEPQGPSRGYDLGMATEPIKRKRAPAPMDDTAVVLVYLDRKTGKVTVDAEFSTPMETWGMLGDATAQYDEKFERAREKEREKHSED